MLGRPDLSQLSHAQKDELIIQLFQTVQSLVSQVDALQKRITELENRPRLTSKPPSSDGLAKAELKAQIAALLQKATHTDEAEKNQPDLDIPAELERRQARLAAIEAAKARQEERQNQSDIARGRSQGDGRKPRDKDGKPKAGRPYQRDFGVPEPKAQSSFTDPDSRIMKRAGGGFDYSYNAQTAVDESHRTAGSRTCWGFASSACAVWRTQKPSSSSCA